MPDIDLKTATPDTTLPTTGFLFGADSQAAASPSVYSTQTVATTLLGSTSLTGATITADAPVLNLSQTWNASGVTFTGLRFNATDTASASGSLLMDLQVGGSSKFRVTKSGNIDLNATGASISAYPSGASRLSGAVASNGLSFYSGDNAVAGVYSPTSAFHIGAMTGAHALLTAKAVANLRLGAADAAAPVAQTLSVQSVVAGTTNTAGANLTITGSQGTGTGAGGSIIFQVAPAGSSGSAQNALSSALTITPVGGSSPLFIVPDYSKFVTNNLVFTESSGYLRASINGGAAPDFRIAAGGAFAFSSDANATGSPDVIIRRDAANTLALRNGANAQTFNVYNTFTSSTNFERFRIVAQSADTVLIGTQKGSGGGTARALALQTDGTTRLTIETNGDLTIADAENIILGTTTGTKIGTATTQKIGFYNKAPVVQPTAVADATDAATVITQLNALLSRMRDLGLIAT